MAQEHGAVYTPVRTPQGFGDCIFWPPGPGQAAQLKPSSGDHLIAAGHLPVPNWRKFVVRRHEGLGPRKSGILQQRTTSLQPSGDFVLVSASEFKWVMMMPVLHDMEPGIGTKILDQLLFLLQREAIVRRC